ncbi:exodeoxyribonuclease VII small subunit [Sphingobacterium suaedae]|uniref:Exodeoxyribonuclease VII small subunit n=1 Tax=Sphingobacterium suaedae TaxID=1686402 RepID=A0ABW5KLE3_9SPHI
MESITYTYQEAFQELQHIVADIENGQTNVDELTAKIRRASELIAICRAKLTASESEVEKLLAKLRQEEHDTPEEE